MLTKPALALWSTEPPARGFAASDVTGEATSTTAVVPLDPDLTGDAVIVAATVVYAGSEPTRAVAVVESAGRRSIARSDDHAIAVELTEQECVGARVRLGAPGVLSELDTGADRDAGSGPPT
jgi:hypothetical protein